MLERFHIIYVFSWTYLKRQIEAHRLIHVWPSSISTILTCIFVNHKFEILTFGTNPAASVSLKTQIENILYGTN